MENLFKNRLLNFSSLHADVETIRIFSRIDMSLYRGMITGMLLALALFLGSAEIRAQGDDSVIVMYERIYATAMKNLDSGTVEQRVMAAYILGSQRVVRYTRPMADALIRDMNNPDYLKLPHNNPFVKAQIAWALGNIGRREAVPDLLVALDSTLKLIEADLKKTGELRAKIGSSPFPVVLDRTEPGPALLKKGNELPYSPSVYWSVADDLKKITVDPNDEGHRVLLEGYNYINQAMAIIEAIGRIGENYVKHSNESIPDEGAAALLKQSADALIPILSHRIPHIRIAAAEALGNIGTAEAIVALEKAFAEEKDNLVRPMICRSVLYNDRSKFAYLQEMIRLLSDHDREVRIETIRTIRDLGLSESAEYLKRALVVEEDPVLKKLIQEAIHSAEYNAILPVGY
jgi:HEAT repeat protein